MALWYHHHLHHSILYQWINQWIHLLTRLAANFYERIVSPSTQLPLRRCLMKECFQLEWGSKEKCWEWNALMATVSWFEMKLSKEEFLDWFEEIRLPITSQSAIRCRAPIDGHFQLNSRTDRPSTGSHSPHKYNARARILSLSPIFRGRRRRIGDR